MAVFNKNKTAKQYRITGLLNEGITHHKIGELDLAESLYKRVRKYDPKNVNAIGLLGVLTAQKENYILSINLFSQAISINPKYADAFYNRGNVYRETGQFKNAVLDYTQFIELNPDSYLGFYKRGCAFKDSKKFFEAIKDFNSAISINPKFLDAINERGVVYRSLMEFEKSIDSFEHALTIDPKFYGAIFNRGVTYQLSGNFEKALFDYNTVITNNPKNVECLVNRGSIFHELKEFEKALIDYERALLLEPQDAEALNNRGITLNELGKFDEAVADFTSALLLKPSNTIGLINRAIALTKLRRLDEAMQDIQKAIEIEPNNPTALNSRGVINRDLGHFKTAMNDFQSALTMRPQDINVINNLGNIYKDIGDYKNALAKYLEAHAKEPNNIEARWNQSLLFLMYGNFAESWLPYECRWERANQSTNFLDSSKPLWGGETGKRVFLWAEQGVGDEIMFSSMLKEVYAASSQLIVQCDQRLIPLFKRSFNDDIIYNHNRDEISEDAYDFHIPMGSLPGIFRPSLKSFKKGSQPFLRFELKKANSLRQKILNDPEEKLIGISWKSKSILPGSLKRNISLNDIVHYINMPKTKLLSLQYGDVSKEIMQLKKETGIDVIQIDEIDNYADIDGLAAIIGACDQVVSIDNATVHLAGALGADTRVLLPYNRDWRWGVSGTTSYWYDSIRLYRQNEPNDWETTLKILREELTAEPASNASALSKAMV